MGERDAEVVIAAGCLFHCVGMSIHREDHERFSLFLTLFPMLILCILLMFISMPDSQRLLHMRPPQ